MRRLLILLLFALPSWAIPALVHQYNATSFPITITATAAGNLFIVTTDLSSTPTAVTLTGAGGGDQATTLRNTCLVDGSQNECVRSVAVTNSGQTSITCTGTCTVTSIHAYEVSGASAFDSSSICGFNSNGNGCGISAQHMDYHPGYSAEFVVVQGTCSGSQTTTPLGGSSWLGTSLTAGEIGAYIITSGVTTVTATTDSGCAAAGVIVAGFIGTGSTQQCAFNLGYYDYSAQGTNGADTIAGHINAVGDLVIVEPWCITTCGISSVKVGTDTLVPTSVTGASNASTGQGFLYYDLSSSVSGAQNIVFTPTGSSTNDQVSFYDFTPTSGCTVSHDVDSALANVSGPTTTANTPSITPSAAGELLFNFTYTSLHNSSPVGSPWSCNNYESTNDCTFTVTRNGTAYILSGASGATANNWTIISGAYQALSTSFALTGNNPPAPFLLLGVGR
jgi:hypothetical protein